MKYYAVEFHIACRNELLQTVRELLADEAACAGFESYEDTEEGLIGYVQEQQFDHTTLDDVICNFTVPDVKISYTVTETQQQDWNEEWENAGFDPIFIGDRCVIFDVRQQGESPLSALLAPLRIGIEARMAFGTGTHETTRMVVSTLLDIPLDGCRVLDCGCGTGILGIVAAKCGAREIVAYDIDEWSVENTRHNASINSVDNIDVLHGDSTVLSHVSGVFDVVLANINRNILLADMSRFCEVLDSGGTLILSGFYEEDASLLIAEAATHDLALTGTKTDHQWTCLQFKKASVSQ
ncbi:MAG: 50S ribosomal protein L11 methyltransferase [Prevotella sp.]|nr:50S ribosomal protein L11 methyltransferase [Prevotella sp.]